MDDGDDGDTQVDSHQHGGNRSQQSTVKSFHVNDFEVVVTMRMT